MLDAFQSAAKTASVSEVGILVPLYDFYPSIESFLDTVVKKTIDQASSNPGLQPFDIKLLQVLFLIRYVEEMKGNVDNLVTLCLDRMDADRLALRRQIEDSLGRLEKETLISRNGDIYTFLTNEERDINKEIKQIDLSNGDEAKLLGEIIFDDVLKGQRKHRFSINKKDIEFNRRCDQLPVGGHKDKAPQISIITPLSDDYDQRDKTKCLLDSTADDGCAIVRLGNEESLGREIRTFLQTDKFVARKNDGTLSESTRRILRGCAEDNIQRRDRITRLLAEMLAAGDYFAVGQALKLKASAAVAALSEVMEYLIQNTFSKMGYLKHLSVEPLKEIQATLRANDTAKETLLLQAGENNPEALEDLRQYLQLAGLKSQPVVLHDMLEKRYSLRPYGWPEEEVLLLLARLVVLGEVALMMDSTLLPRDKVYDAITTPAKRRQVLIRRRETTDPKALQNARALGKDLFAEMGPDGEDALFAFLHAKLKGWQASLTTIKQLSDTGSYPGGQEIGEGLTLINPLLGDTDSKKFIERFNGLKADLTDLSEDVAELEHFYNFQKPTWEKLRKSHAAFQLNRLELEKDGTAGPALQRMQEILAAKAPYGLIKEAEALIATVNAVNSAFLTDRRAQATTKINGYFDTLNRDIALAQGDPALFAKCLKPLEELRSQVAIQESLAHITQAEAEAIKEFDLAVDRIEDFQRKLVEKPKPTPPGVPPVGGDPQPPIQPPVIRKQKVVRPAELVKLTYLESAADVNGFLNDLKHELDAAIANNERIQIR